MNEKIENIKTKKNCEKKLSKIKKKLKKQKVKNIKK